MPATTTKRRAPDAVGETPARVSSGSAIVRRSAAVAKALKESSVQTPIDMAERHLKTRSMLKKRAGRPRSAISNAGEMTAPVNATASAARTKATGWPVIRPASASKPLIPAVPPTKKYRPICHVQTGGLTIGWP